MSSIRPPRAPFRLADLVGFPYPDEALAASGHGPPFILAGSRQFLACAHGATRAHDQRTSTVATERCRYESLLPRPLHQRLNWRS